ncbi:phosphatase PAP2 family protein [Variovorax paradoxus]|uniref:Putative undecaprenyl-diphosphatase YbjG n=1 Tax=Variovorax paradoxus TaxID=34073 RepID=A0A0H2M3P3_VARPD|nr:phosphatase PAP2 family protein [Variovorax paradoxus]KLN56766.1 putative undecaprenyl-diphosphatase YbjG [Variovorax paradoxus]
MNALNLAAFHWIAAGSHPTPWVLSAASALAPWGSWLCGAILVAALWRRRADRVYLCIVAAMAGVTSLVSHAIAQPLNTPRPFVLGLAPAYIEHAGRGGLPSTHAAVMFLVALAFLLRPGLRRLGVALLALAAATGWARIYVGVHFPLDIVAGLLLAGVIAGALAIAQRCVHAAMPRADRASGDQDTAHSLWRPS